MPNSEYLYDKCPDKVNADDIWKLIEDKGVGAWKLCPDEQTNFCTADKEVSYTTEMNSNTIGYAGANSCTKIAGDYKVTINEMVDIYGNTCSDNISINQILCIKN